MRLRPRRPRQRTAVGRAENRLHGDGIPLDDRFTTASIRGDWPQCLVMSEFRRHDPFPSRPPGDSTVQSPAWADCPPVTCSAHSSSSPSNTRSSWVGNRFGRGPSVDRMLRLVRQENGDRRQLAAGMFDGQGSWGNGAALRVAPLGARYAGEPEHAARQGELSALTTHTHPGAVAVAALVPPSAVRSGLEGVGGMLDHTCVTAGASVLGCGRRTSAHGTVPFGCGPSPGTSATSRTPSGTPPAPAAAWTPPAPSSAASTPPTRPGRRPPTGPP